MARERHHRALVQLLVGGLGILILLLALLAGKGWSEAHFMPGWAWSWSFQMRILLGLRLAAAAIGLVLILLVRPWLLRAADSGRAAEAWFTLLLSLVAVGAAFAATEGFLRTQTWRSTQERWGGHEPMRARDPILGWTLVPDHVGTVPIGGRMVQYATGPQGYRMRRPGERIDFSRPTIVFAGESIVLGYGLRWSESLPARVEALSGIQTANTAVPSYATDQMLLRLRRELPRFEHPVAVVIPFMSLLFDRNMDLDRPHLDGQLRWHPGDPPPLRLTELARRTLRYRSRESIEAGTAMTRAALIGVIALARSRGAHAIILVPQFEPESPREREIRRDILDSARIPYRLVPLDQAWRVPGDRHPDARGADALARAVADALRPGARAAAQR